jgi:hypothetical protein
MIRLTKTYFLLLIVLLLNSCDKYPKRGESVNKGDIIDNFNLPDCYSIKTYNGDECVIKSIADIDTAGSSACVPDPINLDFNSFSVIGKTIRFDCSAKIIRELKINHDSKQYIFTIKYKQVGICKRLGFAFNLVTVPKIPADYTVVFNVHKD